MSLKFHSQIESLPLFKAMNAEHSEAMFVGADEKVLKHRQVLFREGEPATHVALAVQGAFKLVKLSPDGHDVIVHFATPGELIGALLMQRKDSVYPVTTIAMGLSIVVRIPRDIFMKSWVSEKSVQEYMGEMMFGRMNLMHSQMALAKAPLPQKIAAQLLSLIERYSGREETILPVPLTRQEISDAVGASVESVIRVMSEWSQSGIIATSDQLIEIKRMDKIIEILKGAPATL